MLNVHLDFIAYTPEAYVDTIMSYIMAGVRRLRFRPFNRFAQAVASELSSRFNDLCFYADPTETDLPSEVHPYHPDVCVDLTLFCENDAELLSTQLLDYLDCDRGIWVAPITRYYFKSRPLFLISVPKGGTHLLYEFVETLGYARGFACPLTPVPGVTYFLQDEHSHTRATDFLRDVPWHAPFANSHHPFVRSPALFIYRNPLDILISEANWYHQDGKNVFAGYFSDLSFEERQLKLIEDPWLLGSIRDRVGAFIAWFHMPNVIPISFEEIVGPQGGGDALHQLRLLWSLQLKLHVPGTPATFADKVFNPNSPTFHAGQIGTYKTKLTPQAREKFLTLPQDFMEAYGFDSPDVANPVAISRHAERFRKRPLKFSAVDHSSSPIMLESGFMEHNLVQYQGRVFGLPHSLGAFDLTQAPPGRLATLLQGRDLNEIKVKVLKSPACRAY
ncbi:MAG TPA: hypothetical protein VKU00_30170 [Chthonomonadaceae bacterium]|nr:hypothetical protein [Chthonomonadaceae bacterium]